jgi:cysteinyl-tRNA synthetase
VDSEKMSKSLGNFFTIRDVSISVVFQSIFSFLYFSLARLGVTNATEVTASVMARPSIGLI